MCHCSRVLLDGVGILRQARDSTSYGYCLHFHVLGHQRRSFCLGVDVWQPHSHMEVHFHLDWLCLRCLVCLCSLVSPRLPNERQVPHRPGEVLRGQACCRKQDRCEQRRVEVGAGERGFPRRAHVHCDALQLWDQHPQWGLVCLLLHHYPEPRLLLR